MNYAKKALTVNFSDEFSLPFILGGTADENISISEYSEIVKKSFGDELECFIGTAGFSLRGRSEKIVSRLVDGRCVTAELIFPGPKTEHTFYGLPLASQEGNTDASFVSSLNSLGFEASNESGLIVLRSQFVTIELGEYICWWDTKYWTRSDFLDEVLDE